MNEIEKELQEIREKKRVIPATFDPVFKSLLTNENNRGYLEDLISYVTKIPKEIISKNMVVVNNQLPIEKYNNKQLNTDILVEIEKNVINLEMNAQKEIGIFEKNAAYYQKLMVDQYKRSADYRNIKRVIQINFNDFKYFSDEDIIIKFQMTSENGLYIDPIYGEVYHVNLAILKKFWYNEGKKQSLNDFDLKLLMLCASERETLDELAERDESLMNVKKNIEELSDDEDIIGLYDVKKAAEWEKNCTKAYFEELEKDIKKYDADVYVIDEFQFLDGNVNCIEEMAESGKKFYIAGLNLTSERKPFGKMGDLLCVSDNVQTMTSICEICRRDNAVFSYYKAGKKNGDIKLGDLEYIPVCRNCYNELNKNKA